jgi:hypothetical protein
MRLSGVGRSMESDGGIVVLMVVVMTPERKPSVIPSFCLGVTLSTLPVPLSIG